MSDARETAKIAKKVKKRAGPKPHLDKDIQFLYVMVTANVSKVDWTAVAKELDITKNAASKRWNRIKMRCAAAAISGKKYEDEDDEDEVDETEDVEEDN